MTGDEKGFLAAIKKTPGDATARGAYADWLEEHDRPYEAALQRDKAGLSEVYFKLRRKSDGLYSGGRSASHSQPIRWAAKGKMWRKLSDLRSHVAGHVRIRSAYGRGQLYGDTPWDDLEVVVIEIRENAIAALPLTGPDAKQPNRDITIVTPEPREGEDKAE